MAAAIIAGAHALRKRVVAEGVETERQATILARLGCDHLQGHFCSRPLSAGNFAQFFVLAGAVAAKKPAPAKKAIVRA